MLRPLVRILLRNQVPYGAFADLAKWVYVDVASKEFGIASRKQTISRISVITGLTRKEVARLQKIATPSDGVVAQDYNRAVRVINGWLYDDRYCEEKGQPAVLPLEGEISFASLVKDHSGDVPAGAILDELIRVKAVSKDESQVTLHEKAYVPSGSEDEVLHILGTDVALLMQTIDHNLTPDTTSNEGSKLIPRYQRKVAYNNVPEAALEQIRSLSNEKAQALLEDLNKHISVYDRDINPNSEGTGRKHVGVGIYYFEEDVSEGKSDV